MNANCVSFNQLYRYITNAMIKLGMPPDDASKVGHIMAEADLQGSDGHGVIRLPSYAKRIKAGGINLNPSMKLVKEKAGMAILDGDNGMGHLVMKRAAEIAIEKARNCGIAWVGSRFSNHAGPASIYARMPMEKNMIGIYFAVGGANHTSPWGGLDMLLSTNPIAIAVPAKNEPPMVLDMATTVTSYGKIKEKAQKGESMPEGWMIDENGAPITDPHKTDGGIMLPIGGYKGYGLQLMVGVLAGTLNAAAMGTSVIDGNADFANKSNTGQAILAIDLDAFGDVEEFKLRVDKLSREMRDGKKMPNVKRIWVPGEQSYEKRKSYECDGIDLHPNLIAQLDEFSQAHQIPSLLQTPSS